MKPKPARDGLYYHGGRNHTFICYPDLPEPGGEGLKAIVWNPLVQTLEKPGDFCKCHEALDFVSPGVQRFRCLGHLFEEDPGTKE